MFAFTLLFGLLLVLLYFFFKTVQVTVAQKGASSREFIALERDQYVPFSTTKIRHALAAMFEDYPPEKRQLLERFFDKLEAVLDVQYSSLSSRLQSDYEIMDPMADSNQFSHLKADQIAEAEDRLLQGLETALQKANYRMLSQELLDFALEEDYLNTLPIECEWERLDDQLLKRYLTKHERNTKEDIFKYADKIWIYHRGIGVDRAEDTFLLQKVDLIVIKLLSLAWRLVEFVTNRANSSSINGRSAVSQELPVDESKVIRRQTLKQSVAKFGLKSLSIRTTLQEPTFKDIIILYRVAKPKNQTQETLRQLVVENAEAAKNENAIFIKCFRNVPMADLELIFPEKKVHMKPTDMLKFTLAGIIGVSSAIVQVGLEPSIYVTASAFGVFLGLFVKFFYDYQAWMLYYENSLNRVLYDKNMVNHAGVILYLVEQLKFQEWKEAAIAFAFLLREGPLSEQNLDKICEKFLFELRTNTEFKNDIDFECGDALDKLKRFNLVNEVSDTFRAVTLENAIKELDSVWTKQSTL